MSTRTALPLDVRLEENRSQLSPRRHKLIETVLERAEETFFLSSRELAKLLDVDAATIVRTIQALGYDRYADFTADLRQYFLARVTPYAVLKAETKKGRTVADHITRSLDRDLDNVAKLKERLDTDAVMDLAQKIHKASHILVVGVDLAASLSWLLAYALVPLGFSAEAPAGSAGNVRHKVRLLGKNDLLIVISFGRCLRESVEAAISARERGVPTFGITDGPATPIALHCDRYLIATIGSPLFTGSYVAPVALIDAILMACSQIRPSRSLSQLRQSEEEYFAGDRFYQEPSGRRAERKQQLLRKR
ncbi:MAG TPA: MurR/RpiR family transcriptional regulator [Thermoanaerobaculia bacterium]|nr:MurR/RpiR family transcriptional regulator [Thermoanaerobaculia bacterium]